jgi:hypothetical protein
VIKEKENTYCTKIFDENEKKCSRNDRSIHSINNKPSQVHDQIYFDIDYHMNPLYELNKNGSLGSYRIFNHIDKLKNQSLWVLLNITDKEDEYLDQIIDK